MLKFEDFVKTFSVLGAWEHNRYARHIYEEIIGRADNRVKMVLASEDGLPALSVCAVEIESYCADEPGCDIDLDNHQVRQAIGRMVKEAMLPLGYKVDSKGNRLPAALKLEHFRTAACYRRSSGHLHVTICTEGTGEEISLSCVL